MDLINWSLNAIDTLFSTRSLGSGEPECPGGTFPAGYTMDGWRKWRILCLAGLSIEDAEDIYLFGTMITGFMLIGAGLALAYRRIKKAGLAGQTSPKLPARIGMTGRAATPLDGLESRMVKTLETLTAAVNAQGKTSKSILEFINERPVPNNNLERKLEQLTAVVSAQNRQSEQRNDNTMDRKLDNIAGRLVAIQREIERPMSGDC